MFRNIFFFLIQSLSSSATDISWKKFSKKWKQGNILSYLSTQTAKKAVSIFKTRSQPYSVATFQCRNLTVSQSYTNSQILLFSTRHVHFNSVKQMFLALIFRKYYKIIISCCVRVQPLDNCKHSILFSFSYFL